MRELLAQLQAGIILSSPIFFLATLLILWRLVRATEATLAVLIYVKQHIEGREPRRSDGIHTEAQLRKAEREAFPTSDEEPPDAGHRG